MVCHIWIVALKISIGGMLLILNIFQYLLGHDGGSTLQRQVLVRPLRIVILYLILKVIEQEHLRLVQLLDHSFDVLLVVILCLHL